MFTQLALQAGTGFRPSTNWMEKRAKIPANKQSEYRKELIDKEFIAYHKTQGGNIIRIRWDHIMENARLYFSSLDDVGKTAENDIPPIGANIDPKQGHITDRHIEEGDKNDLYIPTIGKINKKYRFKTDVILGSQKQEEFFNSLTEAQCANLISAFPEAKLPF